MMDEQAAQQALATIRTQKGTRRRYQAGSVTKKSGWWYAKYRIDVIENGELKRKQVCDKLCPVDDLHRVKSDVLPLLHDKLKPVNSGMHAAESTLTLGEYAEKVFLPYIQARRKASTYHSYRTDYKLYVSDQPDVMRIPLRNWRTIDVNYLLESVVSKHPAINSTTMRHVKTLLSAIFSHALGTGVLSGSNPVSQAEPPETVEPEPTIAHSYSDVLRALNVLQHRQQNPLPDDPEDFPRSCLQGRVAIGLTFFAGLRPGEARGVRWEDYDGAKLYVRRSVWRTHSTVPKTRESVGIVPVEMRLRAMLTELHALDGYPSEGPILRGSRTGRPLDLHNLSNRVIKPVLSDGGIEWRGGLYANRRGIASTCVDTNANPVAAQQLLRHKNLSTTMRHYIKPVGLDAQDALSRVEKLCCEWEAKNKEVAQNVNQWELVKPADASKSLVCLPGAVSSAVRASGLHPEGPVFKSLTAHHLRFHAFAGCSRGTDPSGTLESSR